MRRVVAALGLAAYAASAAAEEPYRPLERVRGVIRVWGNETMAGVVRRWAEGFKRHHPEARIEERMIGGDVAMGALTTGKADIALLGREAAPQEVKGFEWIYRYRPSAIEVLNGSLDQPGCSPALAVLVHRSNPVSSLTMGQLDVLFSADPSGVGKESLRSWDQLGLSGAWAEQTIHLYSPETETGTGVFFRNAALGGTRKLNWERLTEVEDSTGPGAPPHDAGRKLAALVAMDPSGIAVAPLSAPLPANVHVVALAIRGREAAVLPTRESLVARRYPLGRVVRAYVNAAPEKPLDPKMARPLDRGVAEFLRYVLSAEGQEAAAADGRYLPLGSEAIAQLTRLRSLLR
jgi:phosphate transport system substrate-binding protein